METLGNEALGKILNIIDGARLEVELQFARSSRIPQTSALNVLHKANVGTS